MKWLALVLCTSCYPIHKQLQPNAIATVLEANKTPIEGAEVALIASAYPYGWARSRQVLPTDTFGAARFEERREWRWEALMIHGAEIFFWNWCVVKPGFATFRTSWRNEADFVSELKVVLEPGDSTPCEVSELERRSELER